ncbi:MAG: oligosaccharide flippase family protein, partial [Cyclobacteriaceae bacterium]|nr:oligosaccharide flippase family protein [Cyclobacteriaceae bacterium]
MANAFKTFLKFSLGTIVNSGISLITIPIITWFLAPEELGKATMFTLSYNLLLNIFLLGQDQSFIRNYNEVGKENISKLWFASLLPALTTTVFGVALLILFRSHIALFLFASINYDYFVDLLALTLFCGVVSRLAQVSIRMRNAALTYSIVQVLGTISNLALTLLYVIFIKNDFSAVVLSFVCSQILVMVTSVFLERDLLRFTFKENSLFFDIKKNLVYGIPFVPTFICDWLFQSTDRTFLRIYSTFSQVGVYTTATRISASLGILQTGFSTFWIPYVFEKFSKNQNDKSFYNEIFQAVYLSFCFAILGILLFKDLIYIIIPEAYYSSIAIFPILLFVPMFYTLSEITGIGINLKRKTVFHLYILLVVAFLAVVLGYFLIRIYG